MEIASFLAGMLASPFIFGSAILLFTVFMLAWDKEIWTTIILGALVVMVMYVNWSILSLWNVVIFSGLYFLVGLVLTWPQYILFSRRKAAKWKQMRDAALEKIKDKDAWVAERKATLAREASRGFRNNFTKAGDEDALVEAEWNTFCVQVHDSLCDDWNGRYSEDILMVYKVEGMNRWDIKYNKPFLSVRIASWTMYWPAYLILAVFKDVIVEFFTWFGQAVSGYFRQISLNHFNSQ